MRKLLGVGMVLFIHSGIPPSAIIAAVRLQIRVRCACAANESADGIALSLFLFNALLKYCSAAELTQANGTAKSLASSDVMKKLCAAPHTFVPLLTQQCIHKHFDTVLRETNMVCTSVVWLQRLT